MESNGMSYLLYQSVMIVLSLWWYVMHTLDTSHLQQPKELLNSIHERHHWTYSPTSILSRCHHAHYGLGARTTTITAQTLYPINWLPIKSSFVNRTIKANTPNHQHHWSMLPNLHAPSSWHYIPTTMQPVLASICVFIIKKYHMVPCIMLFNT